MTNWFIGIDIIEIQRFRAFPVSEHPRFYARVFTDYEFQYCIGHSDPYPHFAGIFAAKEAVFKSANKLLPLSLGQISIHHDRKGRPVIWPGNNGIHPQIGNKWLENNQNLEVRVSITHSNNLALAWAVTFSKSIGYGLLMGLDTFKAELQREVNDEFFEQRCT